MRTTYHNEDFIETKQEESQDIQPIFSVATWSFGHEEGFSFSSNETITAEPSYSIGTENR